MMQRTTSRAPLLTAAVVLLVILPLASVVAFSTTNPSQRRHSSALSSQYSQRPSSPTSSIKSSALFRRQDATSIRLLPLRSHGKVNNHPRWSRQSIQSKWTSSSSTSSSSSESETTNSNRSDNSSKLQQFLSACDRPLSQIQQWSILVAFYLFHLMVLSQQTILFGWQLIPNNKGHFCSLGWDSVAGMISLAMWIYVKKGSVYFRKPWRKLIENFPSPSDASSTISYIMVRETDDVASNSNSNPKPPLQSTAISDQKAAANKEESTIASKVLQNLPRTMLLKRSSLKRSTPSEKQKPQSKKNESLENLELIGRGTTSSTARTPNVTLASSSATAIDVTTTTTTVLQSTFTRPSPPALKEVSPTMPKAPPTLQKVLQISPKEPPTANDAPPTLPEVLPPTLPEVLLASPEVPPAAKEVPPTLPEVPPPTLPEVLLASPEEPPIAKEVPPTLPEVPPPTLPEASPPTLPEVLLASPEEPSTLPEVPQVLPTLPEVNVGDELTDDDTPLVSTSKELDTTPKVTIRKEDIIIESSRINGAGLANSSVVIQSTTSTDTSSTDQVDPTSSSSTTSETSMYFNFDEVTDRFSSFNKKVQQQFQKIAVATDSTGNDANMTRVEKQGVDLSELSLPTPQQRQYLLTRGTPLIASMMLVQTYFFTGRFSFFWEDTLYAIAGMGFPLTVAMHRSLCVLMGHLTWVAAGSAILRLVVRPKFFGRNNKWYRQNAEKEDGAVVDSSVNDGTSKAKVFARRRKSNWVWWVIGGYCVSSWFFNIADFINLYALPAQVLEDAIMQEGVVTQLINPENNDFLASVVGYIAPCLSAPWWEEILYRGFFFPALSLYAPVWVSALISGIVFSAHHLSLTAALPLAVLGWTWSGLYMASDNLWTTILVHAMWNTRVFLSSWLGL